MTAISRVLPYDYDGDGEAGPELIDLDARSLGPFFTKTPRYQRFNP